MLSVSSFPGGQQQIWQTFYPMCQIKIVANYNFQGTFHEIVSDLWAEYKIFVLTMF